MWSNTGSSYQGADWDRFLAENSDFAATSSAETLPAPAPWRAQAAGAQLEIEHQGAARLSAHTVLPEERLLASSLYQDGGWRVLADGKLLPSCVTNGPFVGGWLPAGARRIELLYRPPGLLAGALAAALGAAAGCAFLARPRRRAREAAPS